MPILCRFPAVVNGARYFHAIHSLAMSNLCGLCRELFSRPKDKYLIQGRSKENLLFELACHLQ